MRGTQPPLVYHTFWLGVGYALIALVVYLSLASAPAVAKLDGYDKLGHLCAYFVLMTWFSQIYHQRHQRMLWAAFFITLGLCLELLQSLTPVRQFELADVMANVTGTLIGFGLAYTAISHALERVDTATAATLRRHV